MKQVQQDCDEHDCKTTVPEETDHKTDHVHDDMDFICYCPETPIIDSDGQHSFSDGHIDVKVRTRGTPVSEHEWEALVRTHLLNEVTE